MGGCSECFNLLYPKYNFLLSLVTHVSWHCFLVWLSKQALAISDLHQYSQGPDALLGPVVKYRHTWRPGKLQDINWQMAPLHESSLESEPGSRFVVLLCFWEPGLRDGQCLTFSLCLIMLTRKVWFCYSGVEPALPLSDHWPGVELSCLTQEGWFRASFSIRMHGLSRACCNPATSGVTLAASRPAGTYPRPLPRLWQAERISW